MPTDKKDTSNVDEPDYYIENGLMVFTKSFHLKRGFCCGGGCRNCPFDHANVMDSNKKR